MSLNDCEKELAKLIHVIVEHGNYVEEARIELAKNTNFSPFVAFRRINASSTGFLTRDDLDDFLRHNGLVLQPDTLNQYLTLEKDKSYRLTYNDFLNQVLPSTDIDLRNACLERPHRAIEEHADLTSPDVDRLITAVYQKGNEYTRTINAAKKKLAAFGNSALERAFQALADDVTGFMSFKSISAFMKQNNYSFDRKNYESFMSKIDKSLTGRITPIDFKFLLFPAGTLPMGKRDNDPTHHKSESIFSGGFSPIKNWGVSPNKTTARKPHEASLIGDNERSLLALKSKSNVHSPNDKFHREQDRKSHMGSTYHPSAMKNGTLKAPIEGLSNTRAVLYNREIAAINDQIVLQNAPGTSFYDKNTKNPLEWRYLDPVYHNYWSYHRDHNRTLSPQYFTRADANNLTHKHRSHNTSRPGTNGVPFFNPTFVDPGTYENLERYPENPFRYTDHGHFFKNYYANLRHNYYDQYYNYIPYKAKISGKSEINSRNSPQKLQSQSQHNSPSPQRYPEPVNYDANNQQPINPVKRSPKNNAVPVSSALLDFPFPPTQVREPERIHNQPEVNDAPYQFVFVSGNEVQQQQDTREPREPQSAIRIEQPPYISPKMYRAPLNVVVDRPVAQVPEDFNNKPYTFVVMNKNI